MVTAKRRAAAVVDELAGGNKKSPAKKAKRAAENNVPQETKAVKEAKTVKDTKTVKEPKAKEAKPVKDTTTASLTAQQKHALTEFVAVTNADKTLAAKILRQANWRINGAINTYFAAMNQQGASQARAAAGKIFDHYRDDSKNAPDEINVEGTGKLLEELEVDLSDVAALIFSELVRSPSLGVITREGFVTGLSEAQVDSLPKLKSTIATRRGQLATDRDVFKNVYNHTFVLALQEKQKSLPMEMAAEFWKVLFSPPGLDWQTPTTPWLAWWLQFYEDKVKRAVNKDLWKQTLTFALATLKDDSLSFWSEESSWPSVIDEFVEWVKEKRAADAMDTN